MLFRSTEIARLRDNYVPGQVGQNRQYRVAKRFLDRYGLTDFAMTSSRAIDMASIDPETGSKSLRDAVIKFTNDAIFSPNPNDIPMWAQTPWGSVMFQLKSYPLMMCRLSKDVLNEAAKGNGWPLFYALTIGTGLAAGSMAIRDIVQGRGGDDPSKPEHKLKDRRFSKIAENFGIETSLPDTADRILGWYLESLLALGGLGLIGDLLYQTADQLDNGAYGQNRVFSLLFGPSVGVANDTFNVAAGVASAVRGDDSNAKERAAVRSAVSRVPFVGGLRPVREGAVDAIAGEAE